MMKMIMNCHCQCHCFYYFCQLKQFFFNSLRSKCCKCSSLLKLWMFIFFPFACSCLSVLLLLFLEEMSPVFVVKPCLLCLHLEVAFVIVPFRSDTFCLLEANSRFITLTAPVSPAASLLGLFSIFLPAF